MSGMSLHRIDELTQDQLLQWGRSAKEKKSAEELVEWSIGILEIAAKSRSSIPEVKVLIECGRNHNLWPSGRSIFSSIRSLTLAAERKGVKDPLYLGVLHLAENTAKVVYSASGTDASFDDDAADWIPVCVQHIYKNIKDENIKESLEYSVFV